MAEHSHHHHHPVAPSAMNKAFVAGIVFNFLFVIIEVVAGFWNHSMSLLADAGHNFMDVGALALSLFAFRMLKVSPNDHYTYGYRKTSILVALFNAVVLLLSVGIIAYEGIKRLIEPVAVEGFNVSIIAAIGIIINFGTAILFFKNKDHDMNIKSAYLHLMSDAAVSLGIVAGGILMHYFGLKWLDAVLSILIAIIILISTWKLLKDSLRLSLDGVPPNINMDDIKALAIKIPGIIDLHHIHVWGLSTTEIAMTAHLVMDKISTSDQQQKAKDELRHQLEHINIRHVTIEVEMSDVHCEDHCQVPELAEVSNDKHKV